MSTGKYSIDKNRHLIVYLFILSDFSVGIVIRAGGGGSEYLRTIVRKANRGDFPDPAWMDTNTLFSPTTISHTRRYSQRINKNPGVKSPRANSFVQLVRNNWNNLSSDIVNRWLRNKMFYLEYFEISSFLYHY